MSHSSYILCEASSKRRTYCILLNLEQSFSSLLFFYLFFLWKIYFLDKLTFTYTSLNLLKTSWIAAILGSSSVLWQLQSPLFRFIPHTLQIPLQSSLHRTFIGQIKSNQVVYILHLFIIDCRIFQTELLVNVEMDSCRNFFQTTATRY